MNQKPTLLEKWFAIDYRSLAFFRIMLGVVMLADIIYRFYDIPSFYADQGVMPRYALIQTFLGAPYFSFHLINGQPFFYSLIFSLHCLAILFFIIGYKTRIASFVCWLLLISLHVRLAVILQGGDVFLRLLAFWALFLPMGARYSIDSALNNAKPDTSKHVLSFGSAGLLIQVCLVYLFTALLKTGDEWVKNGDAIYYALHLEAFTTDLGRYLLNFPTFLKYMTFATLIFEFAGPLLAFIPIFSGPFRTLTVFLFWGFHISLIFTMILGMFSYICLVAWIPFLPTWFWDKISAFFQHKNLSGLKIYYDVDCGFCQKMVRIIMTFLGLPVKVFPANHSAEDLSLENQNNFNIFPSNVSLNISEEMTREHSWIVEDHSGKHFYRFNGIQQVILHSPLFRFLTPVLKIGFIENLGNRFYNLVAYNRKAAGKITQYFTYAPLNTKISLTNDLLAFFFLTYIIIHNIGTINKSYEMKAPLNLPAKTLKLEQKWTMFAPYPTKASGWFIAEAKLKNGTSVDLMREDGKLSWDKPEKVDETFQNYRWRKYLTNMTRNEYKKYRPFYGQYLCRTWNAKHPGNLSVESLEVFFMRKKTLPNYKPSPIEKVSFIKHECFAKKPTPKKIEPRDFLMQNKKT